MKPIYCITCFKTSSNFFKIASLFSKHVQTCSKHDAIKSNYCITLFKTSSNFKKHDAIKPIYCITGLGWASLDWAELGCPKYTPSIPQVYPKYTPSIPQVHSDSDWGFCRGNSEMTKFQIFRIFLA
jgi:hypothetical protein